MLVQELRGTRSSFELQFSWRAYFANGTVPVAPSNSPPSSHTACLCVHVDVHMYDYAARITGVTVAQEPSAGLPGARADLIVEVKACRWLNDVAVVCPASKSVVAWQKSHVK
jgi:hypothetical protein